MPQPEPTSIYFEAQTGLIRDGFVSHSNFYQYRLSPADRPLIETAVGVATPGCGGLQYQDGFLRTLDSLERKHRHELVRADRRW